MSLQEDIETRLPFQITPNENHKNEPKRLRTEIMKGENIYPVLMVENLPETFGNIDKSNNKKSINVSKEEEYLLNLIARIAVEIIIKE
jgi:hypothetical protein